MKYKAFLSSTYKDLKGHRKHVIQALRNAGIHVDPMEDWTSAPEEPKVFSQDRIEGCDLLVLLVAFRRGHVPKGEELSITQMEYQYAVDHDIDVLPFLLDEEALWRRRFDELDSDKALQTWRAELKERHGVGFFNHEPGSVEIAPALSRWLSGKGEAPKAGTSELELRYLREVRRRCGHLAMSSIDPKARDASAQLALEQIFTQLDTLKPRKWQADASEADARRSRELDPTEEDSREPVLAAVSREPHLVLLGKPGSGKSTLVNFVCLCLANERLGQPVNLDRLKQQGWKLPALLPVRVILRDYAARGLPDGKTLWQFLKDELRAVSSNGGNLEAYADVLRRHLKTDGGILLLDGLDEVPEAHQRREKLRKAVTDFAADFPQVRILVTTRPYAYDDPRWQLESFARAYLLDFSQEQIQTYIGRWYEVTGVSDPDLDPDKASRFAGQASSGSQTKPEPGRTRASSTLAGADGLAAPLAGRRRATARAGGTLQPECGPADRPVAEAEASV